MNAFEHPTRTRTLWTSLRTTPLADALRGRLTGSLDMSSVIQAAALEKPLAELTRTVARRTRLWRIEQVDVARELSEHFRDGLAAGRTEEELIRAFGDPRQAARLIRRAKLRARPLLWRVWRRGVQSLGAVAALVVGCYLLMAVRLFAHHPHLAHNYQKELAAPTQNVPEAQRAWPFYRQALLALTPEPTVADESYAAAGVSEESPRETNQPITAVEIETERPGSKYWQQVARWLDANQAAIAATREGAARPRLGFFYGDPTDREWLKSEKIDPASLDLSRNENLYGMMMPQFGGVHRLQLLLLADGRRALAAGDRQVLVDDMTALIGMAEQEGHDLAELIVDLNSYQIFRDSLRLIDEALATHAEIFSDADLANLAHRVASYAGGGAIIPRLTGERMRFHDQVQRMYSDDGRGDGVLTHEGLLELDMFGEFLGGTTREPFMVIVAGLPFAAGVASRREISERGDALFTAAEAEMQQPLWLYHNEADQDLKRWRASPRESVRYAPLLILVPGCEYVYLFGQRLTQERDATLVALALTLYHRQHDAWPERLDQLVPALLPAVPPDRLTGEPIRYRLADGWPLLYSVGPDKVDDGGTPPPGSRRDQELAYEVWIRPDQPLSDDEIGRDWVLWQAGDEPAGDAR